MLGLLAHPEGMHICPSVLDNFTFYDNIYWINRYNDIEASKPSPSSE